MLLANYREMFSRDFVITRGGVVVAEVESAWFRERGVLRVGGEEFVVGRESLFGGTFALSREEEVVARAQKSFWRRAFVVEVARRSALSDRRAGSGARSLWSSLMMCRCRCRCFCSGWWLCCVGGRIVSRVARQPRGRELMNHTNTQRIARSQ